MSRDFKNKRGFGLVELLVSISIMAVILSVVISRQAIYTDAAALTNLADQISLTLVEAQAYGIGVKEFTPGSSDFTIGYGVAFSLLDSGSNTAYLSFADRDVNQIYNGDWSCSTGGASDECLSKVNISRGNHIDSLCIVVSSGTDLCNLGRIDASFLRPNTEARLALFDTDGANVSPPANAIGVRVILKSPNNTIRTVSIYYTGQISVGFSGASSSDTCNGSAATIVGTSNDEILNGTIGDDVIVGNGGNDIISGGNGNDIICAGSGNDIISGENQNDTIIDTGGNNTVDGGNGNDDITTGSGNDNIDGNNGNDDRCVPGGGNDIVENCEL